MTRSGREIVRTPKTQTANKVNNPYTMLPTAAENENAQTDTWDRNNQPTGKDGVEIAITTRVVYDEAGDKILYAFRRTRKFDIQGALISISAETRVTVDIVGPC